MRKNLILVIFILLILLLVVAGCSGGDSETADTVLNPVQTSEPEDETMDSEQTGAQTEAPAGEQETPDTQSGDSGQSEETAAESTSEDEGFTLEYKDFTIYMNQDINDVLGGIGEPIRVFIQESCAFPGQDDHIYAYPGIQIMTYPDGDIQRVHTILIVDDSISIYGNIYLGSSFDDAKAIFGNVYEQSFSMYTFTKGRTTLAFLVDKDNNIEQIVFGLIIN